MQVYPHLCFEGRCDEALEFYGTALGAQVTMMMRYSEFPTSAPPGMAPPPAELAKKVMHARFQVGSTSIMATDGRCEKAATFKGFALTLEVAGVAQAEKAFTALADGGAVTMPLAKTFFSPLFGMVTDRFGVCWMILAAH